MCRANAPGALRRRRFRGTHPCRRFRGTRERRFARRSNLRPPSRWRARLPGACCAATRAASPSRRSAGTRRATRAGSRTSRAGPEPAQGGAGRRARAPAATSRSSRGSSRRCSSRRHSPEEEGGRTSSRRVDKSRERNLKDFFILRKLKFPDEACAEKRGACFRSSFCAVRFFRRGGSLADSLMWIFDRARRVGIRLSGQI